jgi:hypothetical protein
VAPRGISPLIWRRLLVRSDSTIADLHHILQIVYSWSDATCIGSSSTLRMMVSPTSVARSSPTTRPECDWPT